MSAVIFRSEESKKPLHDHCPLCLETVVHPKADDRPEAIIFLDMDGVMIGDRFTPPLHTQIWSTLSALFPQSKAPSDYQFTIAKGRHLDPKALRNLHILIERIESAGLRALVVLSSAWRNDATLIPLVIQQSAFWRD